MGSFSGIKNLIGSSDTNTLQGANGTNAWKLTGATTGTVGSVAFSSFESLVGGTGTDTFTVLPGVSFAGTLVGGGGNDTLVGLSTSGTSIAWVISSPNSGTMNGLPFSGISNLKGGAGNDLFTVLATGSLSGKITGGGCTDTLDYSNYVSPITVDLANSTATAVGGFSGIKNLVGSTAINTLQSSNGTNTWKLTGATSGKSALSLSQRLRTWWAVRAPIPLPYRPA